MHSVVVLEVVVMMVAELIVVDLWWSGVKAHSYVTMVSALAGESVKISG